MSIKRAMKNKFIVKKLHNYSNPWFIISVAVTVLLIVTLISHLIYSYTTIKNFEHNKLAVERASGELTLYANQLEMSTRIAAATGDLSWKKVYDEHLPKVNETLYNIDEMLDLDEVGQKQEKISSHLHELQSIENQAFTLISQGEKDQAFELLQGWTYTKNQLELKTSIESLTNIMHEHVHSKILSERSLSLSLLIFIALSSMLLMISWFISIKLWYAQVKTQQEKEDRINYLIYHDALTGTYNRRFFEEESERLDNENNLPLTLIIGDVNDLKKVNDQIGHKKGDELLIELTRILKEAVGNAGVLARWGGDEFGILLPSTGFISAKKVVEDINKGCKKSDFKPCPSISLGYAIKLDTSQSMDKIFTDAEDEMYRRKVAGKESEEDK